MLRRVHYHKSGFMSLTLPQVFRVPSFQTSQCSLLGIAGFYSLSLKKEVPLPMKRRDGYKVSFFLCRKYVSYAV